MHIFLYCFASSTSRQKKEKLIATEKSRKTVWYMSFIHIQPQYSMYI